MTHRFPIGTTFTRVRKGQPVIILTVSEQLTVTDSSGEVVKRYYHATHEYLGQTVTDRDVYDTTIARNNPVDPESNKPLIP